MLRQSVSRVFDARAFRRVRSTVAAALLLSAAACAPEIDHRGYLPRQQDLQQLRVGMSKAEVESILGSPSTTATINSAGDSYYYVSSVVSQKPVLGDQVQQRQVIAVRFDFTDRVQNFAHYGLEDGRVVNFVDRETPTIGRDESLIREFFGNLGKYATPGAPGAGG